MAEAAVAQRPRRSASSTSPLPARESGNEGEGLWRGGALKRGVAMQTHELAPEQLRKRIDPQSLGIGSTADLQGTTGVVGQERAVAALRFGLEIRDHGFNIYVAGPHGVGKMATVEAYLADLARAAPTPSDWCYVNCFAEPYQPAALRLPGGMGRQLQQDMQTLVVELRRELPRAFESDEYSEHRGEIVRALEEQRGTLLEAVNERARAAGFLIRPTPFGVALVPLLGDRPMSDEEFQRLPPSAREELKQRREELGGEMESTLKRGRAAEREAHDQLDALDREVARYVVRGFVDDLEERYGAMPDVLAYLAAVQADIVERVDAFREGAAPQSGGPGEAEARERFFRRYEVNLLVDNSRQTGAPVVVERAPNHTNLCGRVEKESQFGMLVTDFTMIKAGALHRANGGFLVVPVEDLLREPFAWDTLKRSIEGRAVQIEDIGERLGYLTTRTLRPQPIPLDLKIVLVGPPHLYGLLRALDDQFAELFKVKADFDTRMALTPEAVSGVLEVLAAFCAREGLLPLDAGAAARLLEHAMRLAADQAALSTQFGALTDLVREASFLARREGAAAVSGGHVRQALDDHVFRAGRVQERLRELVARRTLIIETEGRAVGQINGLAVLSTGDYEFGHPTRITASVGPGREGVLDIEREARLGGPIHSKGVMILGGYMAQRYTPDHPLSLRARLVFEQSYEGVEGDSASSAELYALLSALSGLPIAQGIAVTGSLSQRGEIQAIGGVNEKVEGFFDVCRAVGLSGAQGVMIPRSNLSELMLREDVVAAVAEGQFHVWAVATVDEGFELLTGVPAGERGPDGAFPEGSANRRVEDRLHAFGASLRAAGPSD